MGGIHHRCLQLSSTHVEPSSMRAKESTIDPHGGTAGACGAVVDAREVVFVDTRGFVIDAHGAARHHERGAVIDAHGAVCHQRGWSHRRCAWRSPHRPTRVKESSSTRVEPSSTRAEKSVINVDGVFTDACTESSPTRARSLLTCVEQSIVDACGVVGRAPQLNASLCGGSHNTWLSHHLDFPIVADILPAHLAAFHLGDPAHEAPSDRAPRAPPWCGVDVCRAPGSSLHPLSGHGRFPPSLLA